jgi:hypothetical protein
MRMKEKIERAGWEFRKELGFFELYTKGKDKIVYDTVKERIARVKINGIIIYYPDAIQLEIILEK